MRVCISTFVSVCAIVAILSCMPCVASGADVSGTFVVNKKNFKLTHGYVNMEKPEEPIIALSDKPLPNEQIPFLNADYAVKNKVHAVVFGIVSKDKKIGDMRWAYFGGDADIPFTVLPVDKISLNLKRIDNSLVEGMVKTSQPVTQSDLTYSFDASFKLSVKDALAKASAPKIVSFTGDDSAPVKAYKEYFKAIMAGDVEGMKKYLVAKNLKQFESMEGKERAMLLDVLKMRPEKVKLGKPTITGDQASFKAEGKEGSAISTGSIKMVIENGRWKVLEDKWETIQK